MIMRMRIIKRVARQTQEQTWSTVAFFTPDGESTGIYVVSPASGW
jgi:hypothetical protein